MVAQSEVCFGAALEPPCPVLLGALLAPTDPVLASDAQVLEANDRDRLRVSLTGEGGLNDGAAVPFVLLGLGPRCRVSTNA
jgi:NhaP-type Na+/H+ or K+/H+ antiporter